MCIFLGMAQYVSHFAEHGDPEYAPPKPEVETAVCFHLNLSLCYAYFSDMYIFILFWTTRHRKGREFINYDWRKALKRLQRI